MTTEKISDLSTIIQTVDSGFIHHPHRRRHHPCFEEEGQRSRDPQAHSHRRRVRLQSGHQPV
jgi:hypothetical protein